MPLLARLVVCEQKIFEIYEVWQGAEDVVGDTFVGGREVKRQQREASDKHFCGLTKANQAIAENLIFLNCNVDISYGVQVWMLQEQNKQRRFVFVVGAKSEIKSNWAYGCWMETGQLNNIFHVCD